MSTGAAIAVAGGAVLLVFLVTRQQQQKTAAIVQQTTQKPSGPYALSISDQLAIGGTILATYFGGPQQGAKVASALAPQ